MNQKEYGKDAVARYHARHAKADDLQHNIAGFTWNAAIKRYEIVVREHIVATLRTIKEVESFSAMHHDGFMRS